MVKALRILPLIVYVCVSVRGYSQQSSHWGGTGGVGGQAGLEKITSPVLTISVTSLPSAIANTPYSQTLTATNAVGTLTWTIMLGQLPAGLTLNSSTGTISGTPTVVGVNTFTVLVTDSTSPTSQTATQQFTLNVNCTALQQTSTSPLPGAVSGLAYSFQFQSLGGQGSITWTQTGAPVGLSLSSGGLLSGTTSTLGTSTINVTVTDSCPVPQSIQVPYQLSVTAGVSIVTSSPLPAATTGTSYQVTLAAQGGTSPYTWTVLSGALPAGLTLSSSGVLSGTPTGVGTSTFTVRVTDSASGTANMPLSIAVACALLSVTSPTTLPNATQSQPYNFQFTSGGGFGSIVWSLANGTNLPNGLALSTGGAISGSPTLAGSYSFDVSASDSCPVTQRTGSTFNLTIGTGLTITTNSALPSGTLGTAYSSPMAATGGVPPYTWTVPSGTIPAGAEDILDYAAMPVTTRYTSHLSATGLYKAYRIDAGLLWWIKNAQGYPWDGEIIGPDYIHQWFTEMDSSQDAACQAAGWPNCFNDPRAYKMYQTPVRLWKRYHVPGADDVVYTAGPNLYDLTTKCGEDNQTPVDNKGVRGELTGPFTDITWQTTYGGSIPDGTPYLLAQKWIKCTANDIATCTNEEDYWLVKGYGQVRWCPKTWNGSTYITGTCTTQTNVTAGGAPTPNFSCKVPNYPLAMGLPPGVTGTSSTQLDLSDQTGTITGTPSQTGTYTFKVQVEDSVGAITQKSMTMTTACTAMTLTSTSPLPAATQGLAYSYQFAASGGLSPLTWALIQGSLPPGLTLSASGLLSGTPTSTGVFFFVPQALDSCAPQQQSVQNQFQISVQANSGALTINTTSPLQSATESSRYSVTLNATGGTTPYTWSISAGSLPSGLSLAPSTGMVSGTPTSTGTSSFTAKVTDALSVFTTKAFNLTVACPALSLVSTSPLPAATQGQTYSFQFQSTGGIPAITWGATGVPAGLTLSSTGLLSGTPTSTGTPTITVTATDHCVPTPQTASLGYSLTITSAPPPISITTTSPLPQATQGVAYSTQMSATGGTPPYNWSIPVGSMPIGLGMNIGGLVSGTPTTIGTSTPTIKVTDSLGVNTQSVFSITVACVPVSIATSALPSGTQNSPYSFQMTASGGTGALTWSLFGGSFPTGVSISGSGLISGTPSTSGAFNPQIRVTDSCSTPQTATTTFPLTIGAAPVPLQITSTSPLPSGTQNQAYSVTLTAAGGTPPYSAWTVTVGTLPTGLSLNASTGVISGTPTGTGTSSFTVRVTDNVAANATAALSLTINAVSGADNRYCNSNNQVIGLAQDGPAQPLAACMNTALINTPSPGTLHGPYTTLSALQTAINAGACGDIYQVTAGSDLGLGTLTLPAKNCNSGHWNLIETTGISNPSFPAEGTRMTPCWSGVASMPNRSYVCSSPQNLTFKISAPLAGSAIVVNGDHWRIIGANITRVQTPGIVFSLIDLPGSSAPFPNNFILDRVWLNGVEGTFPQSVSTATETQRAITLDQSNHIALIDSYATNFYCDGSITPCDSQVIGGGFGSTANSGWGVYKIVNNHLEAAAEGILLGGANGPALTPVGCTIMVNCNLDVPTDIEARRNYFFKPLQWNGNKPGVVAGAGWPVEKNGFEIKIGARALFEGNVVENVWYSAQVGPCWALAPKNQSNGGSPGFGTAPTALTNDFTYRYNYCYNAANGPMYFFTLDCPSCVAQGMNRVSVHDNLIDDALGLFNTTIVPENCCAADELAMTSDPDGTGRGLDKIQNFSYQHNTHVRGGRYLFGFGAGGPNLMFNLTFQNNIWSYAQYGVGSNPSLSGCSTTNSFYQLLNSCVTNWTVDHNAVFNQPGTLGANWPTNGSGAGNFFFSTIAGAGFVNYGSGDSGFNPGNYALTNVSPLHNAGSDGKDVGVNIQLLLQMIAGVRQ